jgi:hypothetical protein
VVNVIAGSGCTWQASGGASWLTLFGGSVTGSGSISFSVAPNLLSTSRSVDLTVAGKLVTVSQGAAPCPGVLSTTKLTAGASAATGTININAASNCSWQASSGLPWVTLSPASGTGSGTVSYSIAANTTSTARSGAVSVAGSTVTVSQSGTSTTTTTSTATATSGCSRTVSKTSITAAGAATTGTINVTAASTCAWEAGSGASWLTITPTDALGSKTATYKIAANMSLVSRSTTLYLAGYAIPVKQSAWTCGYTLSKTSFSYTKTGGTGSDTVTANASICGWTAKSNVSWITVTAGASKVGSGTTSFAVANNATGASRTGTLTIGGKTVTVTQAK